MSAAALDAMNFIDSFPLHPFEPADPVAFHLHRTGQGEQHHLIQGVPPVRNRASNRPPVDEGPTGNTPNFLSAAAPGAE